MKDTREMMERAGVNPGAGGSHTFDADGNLISSTQKPDDVKTPRRRGRNRPSPGPEEESAPEATPETQNNEGDT